MPELRPYAITRELEDAELEALDLALAELGLAREAWPAVPHLRQWLVNVAVRRRMRRETGRNRKSTTSAIRYLAASFGLAESTVRSQYYAGFHIADQAREKYSEFPTATAA